MLLATRGLRGALYATPPTRAAFALASAATTATSLTPPRGPGVRRRRDARLWHTRWAVGAASAPHLDAAPVGVLHRSYATSASPSGVESAESRSAHDLLSEAASSPAEAPISASEEAAVSPDAAVDAGDGPDEHDVDVEQGGAYRTSLLWGADLTADAASPPTLSSTADAASDTTAASAARAPEDPHDAETPAAAEAPPGSSDGAVAATEPSAGPQTTAAELGSVNGATTAPAAASAMEASTPDGTEGEAATAAVALVRRRVARWYVPGLDREMIHHPSNGNGTAQSSPSSSSSKTTKAESKVARTGTAPPTAATSPATDTGAPPVKSAAEPATAAASAAAPLQASVPSPLPPTSATGSSAGGRTAASPKDGSGTSSTVDSNPQQQQQPAAKETKREGASAPAAAARDAQEAKKGAEAQDDLAVDEEDEDWEELPKALLAAQAERTKRTKRLLMAALGSDFAKAGLSNDGVRTSFSVVNYQTIKQITGLKRVPSKLLISCLVAPDKAYDWIDISMHPTATLSEYKEALQEVLLDLGMHRTMVEDSAEPMLLPQVTVAKGCHSLLLRYAIEAPSNKQMDSFQDLTNRFTVFLTPRRIVTVHRTQCSYVEELKLNWQQYLTGNSRSDAEVSHLSGLFASGRARVNRTASEAAAPGDGSGGGGAAETGALARSSSSNSGPLHGMRYLMYYFVKETVGTFTQAIAKCIVEFDKYEASLFNTQRNRSAMARDIYHIKRRASVYGRTLTLTQDAYAHIATSMEMPTSQVEYQEIMHDLAHVESLAEELNSNADSVLQLLFQLSSYQVNELMRVLTLFSAFFIPLSFIASLYGMNFEDLPMLHSQHGGLFCCTLMCTVASCIFVWFRSNRFL